LPTPKYRRIERFPQVSGTAPLATHSGGSTTWHVDGNPCGQESLRQLACGSREFARVESIFGVVGNRETAWVEIRRFPPSPKKTRRNGKRRFAALFAVGKLL
jgi:hypothetical protein